MPFPERRAVPARFGNGCPGQAKKPTAGGRVCWQVHQRPVYLLSLLAASSTRLGSSRAQSRPGTRLVGRRHLISGAHRVRVASEVEAGHQGRGFATQTGRHGAPRVGLEHRTPEKTASTLHCRMTVNCGIARRRLTEMHACNLLWQGLASATRNSTMPRQFRRLPNASPSRESGGSPCGCPLGGSPARYLPDHPTPFRLLMISTTFG